MKDRLEDFVLKNRAEFDFHEPDPSLWLKINPQNSISKNKRWLIWLRYAAAIAVLFASFSAGIYYLAGMKDTQENLSGELYKELIESEAYYSTLVSQKYNELEPYISSSPEIKKDLDFDLNELDQIYKELKEDLNDNVGNPEVIDAMIQQYRMKVEILEQLMTQLKEKEKINYEDNKETNL